MHTCTHAHMHTCTHAHMRTCTHTHTHTHTHTYTHTHIHTYTHTHIHTYTHTHIHTYTHTGHHRRRSPATHRGPGACLPLPLPSLSVRQSLHERANTILTRTPTIPTQSTSPLGAILDDTLYPSPYYLQYLLTHSIKSLLLVITTCNTC